ncbi:MAG: hypothetical protein JWN23_2496 [Rhodocyclales bacterium]|nr:hypothetical protein [Rhodocyclales bacterium]
MANPSDPADTDPAQNLSQNLSRFANLGFEDFRRMASDASLSAWEKIGFPDSYRQGVEQHIFADISRKLPALNATQQVVLDIGPGCSELPRYLIDQCLRQQHRLVLIDSAEMLALLPSGQGIEKLAARFPDCPELISSLQGRVDALLCYSVFQYIFAEANIWSFLDACLSLLAPGGAMLVGDIPNISKRKRFFASDKGIAYHKKFVGRDEAPEVLFNRPEPTFIDDAVVMGVLARCRAAGFDAYVVPQDSLLPMSNRREDILITKP